ncbi:unnamed protein product [Lepeophtheirus salmonis]|uniref:(salmon louse) hypothetical protein n=1 Tax=Lepeophtheirus salmonis TaxID=72036 RepID=A0A7R8CMZ0_LEPSM|nr:uncharacterized protein LOC121113518 isoform X2 [Lepeophtheirus salmonis]CAB4060731.1 unnamed protein product [Lepeophtheirus salmonis]CAF2870518.1 unnamed protein product [Lepeophtheirus salmonis]
MLLLLLLPILSTHAAILDIFQPRPCECSDFTWLNRGVLVGDCLAVDLEGSPLCYVHQPNRCLDAEPSSIFVGMEASRLACTSRFGGRQSLELEDVMDLEPVSTSSGSLPFIPKNNF